MPEPLRVVWDFASRYRLPVETLVWVVERYTQARRPCFAVVNTASHSLEVHYGNSGQPVLPGVKAHRWVQMSDLELCPYQVNHYQLGFVDIAKLERAGETLAYLLNREPSLDSSGYDSGLMFAAAWLARCVRTHQLFSEPVVRTVLYETVREILVHRCASQTEQAAVLSALYHWFEHGGTTC
ncbi:MAG: hypothetical protein NZ482_03685 [Gloeomargarita sp. SKYG98]|nr:hypothetical protein [Gloeomargarita sp. SKYG98]